MKERGFIAEQHEIKALLASELTQFIRVIKEQPKHGAPVSIDPWEEGITAFKPGEFGVYREGTPVGRWGLEKVLKCPYKVGQRLWMKETHYIFTTDVVHRREAIKQRYGIDPRDGINNSLVYYRADNKLPYKKPGGWRSSTHMPRWASRLSLIVKSVKAEERRMAGWLWVFDCEVVLP